MHAHIAGKQLVKRYSLPTEELIISHEENTGRQFPWQPVLSLN